MENKIIECHEVLNNIYDKSKNFFDILESNNVKSSLNSYNKHYIKINNKYELQKYFMPVISVYNKGDICFNLDGTSLEFFIDKKKILLIDNLLDIVEKHNYNLEIYSNENCLEDLYFKGISDLKLKENILNCNDNTIGITINCQKLSNNEVKKCFNDVCCILNI